MLKPNIVYCS